MNAQDRPSQRQRLEEFQRPASNRYVTDELAGSRDPRELLDNLRLRLERLAANHPSSVRDEVGDPPARDRAFSRRDDVPPWPDRWAAPLRPGSSDSPALSPDSGEGRKAAAEDPAGSPDAGSPDAGSPDADVGSPDAEVESPDADVGSPGAESVDAESLEDADVAAQPGRDLAGGPGTPGFGGDSWASAPGWWSARVDGGRTSPGEPFQPWFMAGEFAEPWFTDRPG